MDYSTNTQIIKNPAMTPNQFPNDYFFSALAELVLDD